MCQKQPLSSLLRTSAAIAIILFLVPAAWAGPRFEVLSHFYAGNNNNGGLWGGLTLDAKGNLYGTTWGGGTSGRGTVFELSPVSGGRWKKRGGVALDQAGNLYGNIGPGEFDNGAVTELVPGAGGWTQNYLCSFCEKAYCPDRAIPVSGGILDDAGNLYGTTEYGGTGQQGGNWGTAYELRHNSDGTWQHQVLYNFPGFYGDGVRLLAGLVLDKYGNLYGATIQGGSIDCGTVFKLTHGTNGWKETIVHDFTQPKSGCGPSAVTFDDAGNLYGTAGGGTGECEAGCGVVFKLTLASGSKWKYNVLHHFTGNDGAYPDAGVTLDQKGNLYGTTELGGGGHSVGVVFEITP
jgi:uncharacterized repeat protein (TIGR03803 family)